MTMKLTHKETVSITWSQIREAADLGKLDRLLASGDTLSFLLQNGTEAELYIDSVEPTVFVGVLAKGVGEREMYKCDTFADLKKRAPVNWEGSDIRSFLNSTIVALLPQELQDILIPYEIIQTARGVEHITRDKLWLPSETQAYGAPVYSGDTDGGEESRMAFFESGYFEKYNLYVWLRSVSASYSGGFCVVNTSGAANSGHANHSRGCAPALIAGSAAAGGVDRENLRAGASGKGDE